MARGSRHHHFLQNERTTKLVMFSEMEKPREAGCVAAVWLESGGAGAESGGAAVGVGKEEGEGIEETHRERARFQ
jgi:hypothetical protein